MVISHNRERLRTKFSEYCPFSKWNTYVGLIKIYRRDEGEYFISMNLLAAICEIWFLHSKEQWGWFNKLPKKLLFMKDSCSHISLSIQCNFLSLLLSLSFPLPRSPFLSLCMLSRKSTFTWMSSHKWQFFKITCS